MNVPSPPLMSQEMLDASPHKQRAGIERSEQNNVRILKPSRMSTSMHDTTMDQQEVKTIKPNIMRELTHSINQLQASSPESNSRQPAARVLKPSQRISPSPYPAPTRDPPSYGVEETGGHGMTIVPNRINSGTRQHANRVHLNNEVPLSQGEATNAELHSIIRRLQAEVETLQVKMNGFLPEVVGRDLSPPWSHALTLQPKDKVVIMGTFPDSGRLTINLCGSNSIPFSFDVRFSSVSRKTLELSRSQRHGSIRAEPAVEVNKVLVTSNPDSKIQEDNVAIVEPVILKDSPFEPSSEFTLEIWCYWGSFVLMADGKFLLDYKYRVPVTQVQSIYVLAILDSFI